MTGKIDTDKSDIKKLFKDFFFLIPNYQRHYVWQIDNVNKLLTNIYDHSKFNEFWKTIYFKNRWVYS